MQYFYIILSKKVWYIDSIVNARIVRSMMQIINVTQEC